MAGKFDLQKIISDVKNIVSPEQIPEANKGDPIGYHLSELSKVIKELAEQHTKQADTIAKVSSVLGSLHQAITAGSSNSGTQADTKPAPEATETAVEPEQATEPESKEEQPKGEPKSTEPSQEESEEQA